MKVLICGDRKWTDYEAIYNILFKYHGVYSFESVIEGEASGADSLGRVAAEQLKIPVQKFPADWVKYGNAAGPIRNQQMLDEGKPDIILAFHDNISASKGTQDMITRAKKANIRIKLCYHQLIEKEL